MSETDGPVEPPPLSQPTRATLAVEAEDVVAALRTGTVPRLSAAVLRAGEVVERLVDDADLGREQFHHRLSGIVRESGGDAVVTVMPMAGQDGKTIAVVWGEEHTGAFAAVIQPYQETPQGMALFPPSAAGPGQAGNLLLMPVRAVWAESASAG